MHEQENFFYVNFKLFSLYKKKNLTILVSNVCWSIRLQENKNRSLYYYKLAFRFFLIFFFYSNEQQVTLN